MPKQTRWKIKQSLDGASGNLNAALDKVLEVAKPFEHVHDDYFDALIKIAASIKACQDAIIKVKDSI